MVDCVRTQLRTKIDGEAGPSSVTGVKRDWRFKTVGRLTTDRRVSIASVAQYIRKPSTPPQELTFPSCRGAFCLNKQSSEIASTNEHAAIRKKTSATNEHAAIQERTSATNERAAIRKKTSAIVDSDWCSPFRTDESRKTDFSQDADESNLKISKAEHIWKKGSPMQKWANSTKVPLPPSVLLNALRVRRQKEALEGSIVGPRRRTLNEILEVRRKESLVVSSPESQERSGMTANKPSKHPDPHAFFSPVTSPIRLARPISPNADIMHSLSAIPLPRFLDSSSSTR